MYNLIDSQCIIQQRRRIDIHACIIETHELMTLGDMIVSRKKDKAVFVATRIFFYNTISGNEAIFFISFLRNKINHY